jgi:hypothetical protein
MQKVSVSHPYFVPKMPPKAHPICLEYRKKLADGKDILIHSPSTSSIKKGVSAKKFHKDFSSLSLQNTSPCSLLFLSYASIEWFDSSSMTEGRLDCPFCSSKIGKFCWSGGPCSCGMWSEGVLSLQRDKIDLCL